MLKRWNEKIKIILLPAVPFIFAVGWLFYVFGDKPRRPHNGLQDDPLQDDDALQNQEILQNLGGH